MTPKRLLNSTEAGKRMGLSRRAVTQRLKRGSDAIAGPDYVIPVPGIGDVHGWLPERDDLTPGSARPHRVARLPPDPSALPGDALIGPVQWARLAGITYRWQVKLRDKGDIPEPDEFEGDKPRWHMATYREWDAERGKNVSEEEKPRSR
jgi:hypothetical protein